MKWIQKGNNSPQPTKARAPRDMLSHSKYTLGEDPTGLSTSHRSHKNRNEPESPLVSNRITRILFADAKTVTFML